MAKKVFSQSTYLAPTALFCRKGAADRAAAALKIFRSILHHLEAKYKAVRPDASAVSWTLRFVGSFPGVMTILPGMTHENQHPGCVPHGEHNAALS